MLSRHIAGGFAAGLMTHYRGEVRRLRGEGDDIDQALADYRAAAANPEPPPQSFRGIGLICRQRGQREEAREAFRRYLELAPAAPDAAFIKTYVEELSP
jgi:regulator of sirC expression with transglutaminase-like and TPR domain